MKSQLMKTAWQIFRNSTKTFSEALTAAWSAFKNDVAVIVNTAWNGTKVLSFGKNRIYKGNVDDLLEAVANDVPYNNDGAALWYDGKTFNND